VTDIFTPGNTQKAIHATLTEAFDAIPPGHTKALIIDGTFSRDRGGGVRGMYVQRADNGWAVVIQGAYTGTDGAAGKVTVGWSGK
jgi:hypothetical protein